MEVYMIRWIDSTNRIGVVGIFDDEELANKTYDALEQHGSEGKSFYLDTFTLNEIRKGK